MNMESDTASRLEQKDHLVTLLQGNKTRDTIGRLAAKHTLLIIAHCLSVS